MHDPIQPDPAKGPTGAPLTDNLEIYRRVFLDSTDAIVITDERGGIVVANPAWLKLYGYTLDEVLGRTTGLIRSRHSTPEMYAYMWSQITDPRKGYWTGEIVNRKKNGEEVPVLLTITPVREGERIIGYMGLGIDRTERKQLDDLREVYAAVVQHDLKAPLAALLALLDAMLDGYVGEFDERQAELLTRIQRLGQRMQEMIATGLDIEKLKRGMLRVDATPADIFAILRTSLETLEDLATRKSVRVSLHAGERPPAAGDRLILNLDPIHLQRCTDNLLKNAIEASPPGEEVRVTVGRDEGTVRIQFCNGGAPIPPDVRATLFHPFSTYGKRGGTGLGIYGVKLAVEAMGGQVSYETGEDGTCFEIAFPAADESSQAPTESRRAR